MPINMNEKQPSTIPFYGLNLFGASKDVLLQILTDHLYGKNLPALLSIATPNPEQIVMASKQSDFKDALHDMDILLPDGEGLVWAVNRTQQSAKKLQRIPGREVFHDLLNIAADSSWKIFLLGGKPGSARLVVEQWKQHAPSSASELLFDEGALDITHETQAEKSQVLEKIRTFKPQIVFVAYGAPWQEYWVRDNLNFMKESGVRVVMVVGGAFEYEAHLVPPVSSLVASLHIEWLQRLLIEPWRWKRQLKGLEFFIQVLRGKY